jgi:hypothetical protein
MAILLGAIMKDDLLFKLVWYGNRECMIEERNPSMELRM